MAFLPLIATIIAIIVVGSSLDFEIALLVGLVVSILSLQWVMRGKFKSLTQQLDELSSQLVALKSTAPQTTMQAGVGATAEPGMPDLQERPAAADIQSAAPAESAVPPSQASAIKPEPAIRPKSPVDHFEDFLRRIEKTVISYFTDGNIFVRVGILILFFGVAFLLKYAAEHSRIPLEFRFMGAAFAGLVLLIFGWRLRLKKTTYALLLQGGGLGIIYITLFAAYQLANLLPSTLAFVLMVFFSVFTVTLAVLQNSRALAIFAVVGGFLAPFLASSGSGNYIGLFSYYAILNAAIFAVAWFKTWRMLNLLGFIFTFGTFILWIVFSYKSSQLLPATSFLLLFFLMYSLIGVLYAIKQPQHLTGLVDGTLVFGTPVIASSLLMLMLRNQDYGIAGISAGIGIYYVLLAKFSWNRAGAEMRLLAEAMLAIGVVFATLAIPYSLDGHWSSATWALEAAGILWVALRQKRFYAQCFAIALQLGAGVLFLLRNADDVGNSAWMNPAFLGGVFIALGAFISARILYLQAREFKLRLLHIPFFIWAMAWWLLTALVQIDEYLDYKTIAWLILFSATASLLAYLDRKRLWQWMPASISALLMLPVLIVIALHSLYRLDHVLAAPDLYFWLAALTASYQVIKSLESVDWSRWIIISQHSAYVLFLACLLSLELVWVAEKTIPNIGQGFIGLAAVFPLLIIDAAQKMKIPACVRLGSPLQLSIIAALLLMLVIWSLASNLTNTGDPSPLPYLPLINPLDLAHIGFFVGVMTSLRLLQPSMVDIRQQLFILFGGVIFIWLSAVLIRSMHHYMTIPFDLSSMAVDTRVQTALSILWTIIGMLAMLFAARRMQRPMWIAGAILIAVVLVKMIFVDLGASGTVERIVSFLVVGGLLVAMGYFSPIPEKEPDSNQFREALAHE